MTRRHTDATHMKLLAALMKLLIAMVVFAVSGVGDLPGVHAESDYVVVASTATIQDPAWKKVADALLQK
ncbi:MAG: hypothetical protein WCG52_11245, partial [bacterium]